MSEPNDSLSGSTVPVNNPHHSEGLLESVNSSIDKVENNKDSDAYSSISQMEQAQNKDVGSNILSQYSESSAMQMGRNYAAKHDLDTELFARAAAVARSPSDFNSMEFLSEEEKIGLNLEATKRWHVPKMLMAVIALGSTAAAVQGMDESVINGATLFYPKAFGVDKMAEPSLIEGLVNGAPYLCCGVIACWTSDFWNRNLGRKWTVFLGCSISAATCIWQGFVNTWWHLFIARFFLGFGVGINSATVPAYAAECAPKHIRGSLVMLWQFFTAVGIMFGYVASLAFYHVPKKSFGTGLNWRLMLGSACIPAFIVLAQVPFVPESPKWLMGKGRHKESYESMKLLRVNEISAARDTFYQYVLLQEERSLDLGFFTKIKELFTIRRNRNGAIGAWIVMFMQQFCGINVIAYYSSTIFIKSGFSEIQALIASWGFGMLNFVFAVPAFFTIDKLGRRTLLLITFPLMAIFLMIAGLGFVINGQTHKQGRLGMVILGIYLFTCVYSSGEGPVPYAFCSEAYPLYIRDVGMSWATATTWFFNFILAFITPKMIDSFKEIGTFFWYVGWNVIGFFLVLWFLPETKGLALEELDEVFDVPIMTRARFQTQEFWINIQNGLLRRNVDPLPPLTGHKMAVTNPEWNNKAEVSHVE